MPTLLEDGHHQLLPMQITLCLELDLPSIMENFPYFEKNILQAEK